MRIWFPVSIMSLTAVWATPIQPLRARTNDCNLFESGCLSDPVATNAADELSTDQNFSDVLPKPPILESAELGDEYLPYLGGSFPKGHYNRFLQAYCDGKCWLCVPLSGICVKGNLFWNGPKSNPEYIICRSGIKPSSWYSCVPYDRPKDI